MLCLRSHCQTQGHLDFLLSSKSFLFHSTFRSLINFELIFVDSVRAVSRFISFIHVDIQLLWHHLLKRIYFLGWIASVPWSTFIFECWSSLYPGTKPHWLYCSFFWKYVDGFDLLIFCWQFLYLYLWRILVCNFLFCTIIVSLWHQGNIGLLK